MTSSHFFSAAALVPHDVESVSLASPIAWGTITGAVGFPSMDRGEACDGQGTSRCDPQARSAGCRTLRENDVVANLDHEFGSSRGG